MRPLSLIALVVFVRVLWNRQLAFEQDLCSVVSDLQVETLEMVEQYADRVAAPSNGSHG